MGKRKGSFKLCSKLQGINKELVVKRTEGPYKHIDSVDEELIPRVK